MKKGVFVIIFAAVLLVSCFAQSSSSEQRRLIGTWDAVSNNSGAPSYLSTWVFNADGTIVTTSSANPSGSSTSKFAVTDTQIAICSIDANGNIASLVVIYNYSISSDGRTLIISFEGNNTRLLLTKR